MTEYMAVDLWHYTFFISALCGGSQRESARICIAQNWSSFHQSSRT